MKEFFTILKKELKVFFTNPRLLICSLVPSFIMLLFLLIMNNFKVNKDYSNDTFKVAVFNNVEEYTNNFTKDYKIEFVNYDTVDEAKENLNKEELSLVIVYPTDFKTKIDNKVISNVDLYYNSMDDKSTYLYEKVYANSLTASTNVSYNYTINNSGQTAPDVSNGKGTVAKIMGQIVPWVLITVLFTGCMSATVTSIAGEKERGTMATLLITPVKRSTICFGKVAALSIIALFTSAISTLFTYLAGLLSKNGTEFTLDFSIYSPIMIFAVIFIITISALFFTAVIACISTYAKSVKEAETIVLPIYTLVSLLAMMTLLLGLKPTNAAFYAIPFYSTILMLSQIFSLSFNAIYFLIASLTTVLYTGIAVFICKKMFDSERIMFSKK